MVVAAATAAICNMGKRVVCKPPFIGRAAPCESCCANLRVQERCLCKYVNRGYMKSPNAWETVKACGIPIPWCTMH
ncbi:hypothetical protein BRADI_3g30283v3 [Brachypodium distachyon]|uniref:Bifunctional inhibitor/plant lipid transfer protein/seed storage helical domain-containing protein n=1 Tax=Brachypodium distachyon TaxID=15368 RepID=A0A0Q3FGX4_BRADI|nr:hypothetical protein BRADI_3g30283v3 [Brachypodium distachyon]